MAGLYDGPGGQLGKPIWRLLFLGALLLLMDRTNRSIGTTQRVSLRAGGYGFRLELTANFAEDEQPEWWNLREQIDARWYRQGKPLTGVP
jgi:hypothetical protein